ncbi:site-2 protease family protein [Dongia rigui]|uniref:Site-2 protease family protein n=1 Tax=Dongia rigui TaxID=940149 RepID=A0ABU5DS84_9PROT|nr:site-2 protease family protein [Dongia rigui]MDY0870297.1 site-2 protease family protein [Dongia rigui]
METLDFGHLAQLATTWALPVLIAITLHEASHAYVAWRLGDDTAYLQGRVTFNPLKHVDPFGTVILPALLLMTGSGFLFGYAKPVPVNFRRLKHFRRDSALVAIAGPGSNMILAVVSALLLHVAVLAPSWFAEWSVQTLINSMRLNIMLALFNMLPLLPLDGGRVLAGILPPSLARPFFRTERYGMFVLLALIFLLPLIGGQLGMNLNILGWILGPASDYLLHLVVTLTGLTG